MGSTSSSATVSLLFPLGMAIRHGASSSLLPSCSHLFASLLFLSLLALYRRFYLVLDVLPWLDALLVLPYCSIVAVTATFNQHNEVFPPSGHWTPRHWNPESMHRDAPGHWNLGTLEQRVHREGNGHRPENRQRAPSQGTALTCSGTPLASPAVRRHGWVHVAFRCVSLFPKCF